ncbi:SURF1 family cytochrome oxidase biogenesis protein [Streptomyces laculatispora]|uniref:SURF1 family cytochrome oxidase biogenesis protein n=1 Tax=Streptomyces laculatispora TaxID=887464 RepID=UPI001A949C70|nr:SURF1 family protein [Streptomyces laculatispora]MBO0913188.1 SURF1 family protein [Streptomyces laculatispora]
MYRFLLTRQWLILALLALVMIPTMIELGFWQLHRHEHKVAQNALISHNLKAKPVPVAALTSPGHTVPRSDYWRAVKATGTYDEKHEVVVRRRTATDGSIGFHVLVPFDLKGGGTVMINRGWIPTADDQRAFPDVPAVPKGEVTVTGRLKADETTGSSGIKDLSDLPDRQVMLINSAEQAKLLSRPVLGGYLEQTGPVPAGDTPELIEAPDDSSIGPHMAYAVQWWLFAAGVPVGYVVLARREKRDLVTAAAEAAEAGGAAAEPGKPEPAKA